MPISPDADYCLGGAVSFLAITCDIYHGAYVGQIDVNQIVDAQGPPGFFEATVERMVLDWRETASPNQRAYMAAHGLLDVSMQIDEAVHFVSDRLVTAHLRGMGLAPPDPDPFPDLSDLWFERFDDAAERAIPRFPRLLTWAEKLGRQYQRSLEAYQAFPDTDAFLSAVDRYRPSYPDVTEILAFTQKLRPQRINRRDRRRARRVINRGICAFAKIFGPEDIHTFISKGHVVIEGNRYNYQLSKRDSIVDRSVTMLPHPPFRIVVCDKNGTSLASACIYAPDTPILDQILILAMNVKDAGSEIDFLRIANLSYANDSPETRELRALAQSATQQLHVPLDDNEPLEWVDENPTVEAPWARQPFSNPEWGTAFRETQQCVMPIVRPVIERGIQQISDIPADLFARIRTQDRHSLFADRSSTNQLTR